MEIDHAQQNCLVERESIYELQALDADTIYMTILIEIIKQNEEIKTKN